MSSEAVEILLVEDDRFLRRACEASLHQRGFVVTCATDGEEGLRLAQSEMFDLILLDLLMPKKPGTEVLAELRAEGSSKADLPVMILSNSSRETSLFFGPTTGALFFSITSLSDCRNSSFDFSFSAALKVFLAGEGVLSTARVTALGPKSASRSIFLLIGSGSAVGRAGAKRLLSCQARISVSTMPRGLA